MEDIIRDLVRKFYESKVIEFGEFTLSSGRKSNYYIDLRKCLSHPGIYLLLIDLYTELLSNLDFEVVVGIATGGLPWASMLAYKFKVPLAYVRSERKGHGKTSIIEGEIASGVRAVIIDDVATTGSSIKGAVDVVRDCNVEVHDAVVAVDRGEGASELLESINVNLHSILSASKIFEILREERLGPYGVER